MSYDYKQKRINDRQEILEFIKKYLMIHGYVPSSREIASGTKKTGEVVCRSMERLKELGEIETDEPKNSARAYRVKGMKVVFK